jgi:hypothetical protein
MEPRSSTPRTKNNFKEEVCILPLALYEGQTA